MHIIHEEIGFPKIVSEQSGDGKATFTISPLPSGFGMTLGNSLRRVLLSSVPGSAVTAVKIEGASHEYSTISGMTDSVLHLILNLKRVAFKKHSSEMTIVHLEKKSSGDVTAKAIETSSDIEVLNPDHILTSLDKKTSKLSMDIRVEKGVGYLPARDRQKIDEDAAEWILVDAIFSPVKRVKYEVTPVRVGQMTNLDKLIMEIETDGSISPEDAMKFSAKILESYFEIFQRNKEEFVEKDFIADFDSQKTVTGSQEGGEEEKETYTPVEILNLSPRTLNALINGDIGSIEELVQCTEDKLDTLRGFGKKAMNEVIDALAARGLKLMD